MQATIILAALGLLASSATMSPPPVPRPMPTFASAQRTCAVLQAAYTAAIRRDALAFPPDVRSSPRRLESLQKFVPDYRERMPMSAGEFDEFVTQEDFYNFDNFRPACEWKGKAGPTTDNEGHHTFVTFTSPIFSSKGNLALAEVSFREDGIFGYGLLCTARLSHTTWTARCLQSWIS